MTLKEEREKIQSIYSGIKERCYKVTCPSYKWYGEKGIKLAPEFSKFENFYNYLITLPKEETTQKLTLDRIDPTKGYEPGNLRWATYRQQAGNRSKRSGSTSRHIGVWKSKQIAKPYRAQVVFEEKRLTIGYYETEDEAALVRDKFVIEHNLPYRLNFPELKEGL